MTGFAYIRRAADGESSVVEKQRLTIGRSDTDVVIPLAAISRRHAEIDRVPHGYTIRDVGSRNGTFVNGERIGEVERLLRDGDEILLAGVELFTFVDPRGTPAVPAIGRRYGVWIDPDSHKVWIDSQPMEPPLSDRQLTLLELLDRKHGVVVPRQEIIDVVWADVAADGVSAEAIDSLIKRVKKRLRELQLDGDYLEVHRGRGVRLRRP